MPSQSGEAAPTPPNVTPPVDLNKPVSNPDLVAAISAFMRSRTRINIESLQRELNRAVYLLPTIMDDGAMEQSAPGQMTIRAGSKLKIPVVGDQEPYLPLFTDWEALRAWIQVPVSGMVVPADQAWDLAMSNYAGAAVNPGTLTLSLPRELLADLVKKIRS